MAGKLKIDAKLHTFEVKTGVVVYAEIGTLVPVLSDCEKLLQLIEALQATYAELCPILQAKPARKKATRKK